MQQIEVLSNVGVKVPYKLTVTSAVSMQQIEVLSNVGVKVPYKLTVSSSDYLGLDSSWNWDAALSGSTIDGIVSQACACTCCHAHRACALKFHHYQHLLCFVNVPMYRWAHLSPLGKVPVHASPVSCHCMHDCCNVDKVRHMLTPVLSGEPQAPSTTASSTSACAFWRSTTSACAAGFPKAPWKPRNCCCRRSGRT